MQSKDGTKVNGVSVRKPAALKDGDTISVGDATIQIGFSPHGVPAAAATKGPPAFVQPDAAAEWAQTVIAPARILEEAVITEAIPLTADALFIGRDPRCGAVK